MDVDGSSDVGSDDVAADQLGKDQCSAKSGISADAQDIALDDLCFLKNDVTGIEYRVYDGF